MQQRKLLLKLRRFCYIPFAIIVLMLSYAFIDIDRAIYESLNKPVFMPSIFLIGCVWIVVAGFLLYSIDSLFRCGSSSALKQSFYALFALYGSIVALSHYMFFCAADYSGAILMMCFNIFSCQLTKNSLEKYIGRDARFVTPFIVWQGCVVFLIYCIAMMN